MLAIAIDGPAASGKSTAAKGVAKKLDFLYVDTGAMYRALTLRMLELSLDPKSRDDAIVALQSFDIKEDRNGHIFLNGKDVTDRVRMMDVSSQVSYACAHKEVRERCVEIQREIAKYDNVVMEGRDIGSFVLKDAFLKVYQIASVEARARRRFKENQERGIASTLEEICADIEKRDYIDSHREISPLTKAEDAIVLDTSDMTIEEEIDAIVSLYEERKASGYGN